MKFGFENSRPSLNGYASSAPRAQLRYVEPAPLLENVVAPRPFTPESPVLKPGLVDGRKPWHAYWTSPLDETGRTRADALGELGSALRDRDQDFAPVPQLKMSLPAAPTLAGRGGGQGSSDVLRRVKARYGL